MLDEDTGAEPRAMSASIADPYLLIIRDDSSAFIAKVDSSNELEELGKEDQTLVNTKWLTGCLYTDTAAVFAEEVAGKGAKPAQSILLFLLSATGALYVSAWMGRLSSLRIMLTIPDLSSSRPLKTRLCRRRTVLYTPWSLCRLCR
jgi:hypothetical protein